MKKILFYGMTGEKMCFQHIFLNALDLDAAGYEVKIIFEGASVKLLPQFHKEENPLYLKAQTKDSSPASAWPVPKFSASTRITRK